MVLADYAIGVVYNEMGSAQYAAHKPCRTSFARRQFATQTARRKPCGQPAKTTIDKLKKQNPNRFL